MSKKITKVTLFQDLTTTKLLIIVKHLRPFKCYKGSNPTKPILINKIWECIKTLPKPVLKELISFIENLKNLSSGDALWQLDCIKTSSAKEVSNENRFKVQELGKGADPNETITSRLSNLH
eukprot:718944_1